MMYLLAFASSALACLLIVRSARLHLRYTADHPGIQPQKFHTQPTPRVGGLGVLVGIVVAGLALPLGPGDVSLYWLLMLSLLPAFLGGFAEDVTRRVGPFARLLLTVITAACAYSLAGVHFVRSHVGWLDHALAFAPFGYAALLFGVAGVAHALNIIDGYNGLASGFAVITLLALGHVAGDSGDAMLTNLCYGAAAATMGFFVFNYPRGRLFLGDGGAYLLGCIIALASALLVLRDNAVSPWFPLALVIYPVWETVFSALRRVLVHGTRAGEPDAWHMHSLIYRRIARRWVRRQFGREEPMLSNALTTLPLLLVYGSMAALAAHLARQTRALQLLALLFVAVYCVLWWRLSLLGPIQRPRARSSGARAGRRAPWPAVRLRKG